MKSLSVSRIVVVADSGQGEFLATRLRRMNVAEVRAVTELEEARRLCQSGHADACLVAVDAPVPDCVPPPESDERLLNSRRRGGCVNPAMPMLAWWRSMRQFPIAFRPLKAMRQGALAAFRR
jgi:hypothetical protein